MSFDWARTVRMLKGVGFAIMVLAIGILVFLVIDLTATVATLRGDDERRERVIEYLQEDASSGACRDGLEDKFLATVGELILTRDDVDQRAATEELRKATDRIAEADTLCPHAEVPAQPEGGP